MSKKRKSKARIIIEWSLTIVFGALFLLAGIAQIDGLVHRHEHFGQTLRFGWGSFVVLTDSMEPNYPVNSAIVTYLEKPSVIYEHYLNGDIIDLTFENAADYVTDLPDSTKFPQYTYRVTKTAVFTHRLFEMRVREDVAEGKGRYLFFVAGINTNGDNWKENQYQLFTEKELLGQVKINSPFLGWLFGVLGSPWGLLIFLLVPATYLVVVSVMDIFKTMNENEEKIAAASASGAPVDPNDPLAGLSEKDKERLKAELLESMLNQKGDK